MLNECDNLTDNYILRRFHCSITSIIKPIEWLCEKLTIKFKTWIHRSGFVKKNKVKCCLNYSKISVLKNYVYNYNVILKTNCLYKSAAIEFRNMRLQVQCYMLFSINDKDLIKCTRNRFQFYLNAYKSITEKIIAEKNHLRVGDNWKRKYKVYFCTLS